MSTPNNESMNDLKSALFGEDGILLHPDVFGESAYNFAYEDIRDTFDSAVDGGLSPRETFDLHLAELGELAKTTSDMAAQIGQFQSSARGWRLCHTGSDSAGKRIDVCPRCAQRGWHEVPGYNLQSERPAHACWYCSLWRDDDEGDEQCASL